MALHKKKTKDEKKPESKLMKEVESSNPEFVKWLRNKRRKKGE